MYKNPELLREINKGNEQNKKLKDDKLKQLFKKEIIDTIDNEQNLFEEAARNDATSVLVIDTDYNWKEISDMKSYCKTLYEVAFEMSKYKGFNLLYFQHGNYLTRCGVMASWTKRTMPAWTLSWLAKNNFITYKFPVVKFNKN